jgi:exosortase/archaeosortase family protein
MAVEPHDTVVCDSRGATSTSSVFDRTAQMSRRELLVWLACVLLANQVVRLPAVPAALDGLYTNIASRSVFYYLGWYAVFRLLLDAAAARRPATGLDVAVAISICSLNVFSGASITWIGITAAAIYVLVTSNGDGKMRAAAAVMLALSFNGLWGPKLFGVFAYYLLRADAALVGWTLAASQPDVNWHETIITTAGGHSIMVYGPCSSFHNISLGLLCWVSLTKLARSTWLRSDLAVGLAVCASVVALNTTRLYLMALSPDNFAYWHDGFGQHLFVWGMMLTVLGISLGGVFRAGRTT